MIKDTEILKFEATERALQLEICVPCSFWQSTGDMASCMFKCGDCGERRARMNITSNIKRYASLKQISYNDAWDIAFDYLRLKQKEFSEKGNIYFDEDHFETDLHDYFFTEKKIEVTEKKTNFFKRLWHMNRG